MDSRKSPTVYYSRRVLITWTLGAAAAVAILAGAVVVTTGGRQAKKIALLRGEIQQLAKASLKLRASNTKLEKQAASLHERLKTLPQKKPSKPVPALSIQERLFTPGLAVEIVPARLFVTLARLDGERARIRVAELEAGETRNTSRVMSPGQIWRIETRSDTFILLYHSLKGSPPEVRLSVSKLPVKNNQ
ncbi:MAG: hypothetical protein HOJ95_07600 [Nitrospinaceae bacterium]|nr:hypothetical protein [Nitrospinaceae bacterium]MBT5947073.1 hypothetical protein [Nitrospinaceae bacterium]MBT6394554.1 hypothetical protein [Nitrospinaceae bacterium]MBT7855666.1 hypothetical protein [Nitrospinaceae bacterium]